MTFRLGKHPPVHDDRTLLFSNYKAKLAPPAEADFMSKIHNWPKYDNDTLADCVEASSGHQIEAWTWYAQRGYIPATKDIVRAYSAVTGYVPGDASTDQGTNILSFLKYWRKVGIAGHKIAMFMQLKTGDWQELQQAIAPFGSVMVGVALPDYVLPEGPDAPDWTSLKWAWRSGAKPNPNNGHCIPAMKYLTGPSGEEWASFVSWGAAMEMDRPFYEEFSDEAWAIVTPDFIRANGLTPSGLDLNQALVDLAAVVAA